MFDHPVARRGLTLLEILVTAGIVGVMLALALPALSSATDRGNVARSLASHRQICAMVALHCGDHDDRFPFPYIRSTGPLAEPVYEASSWPDNGFELASMNLQARIWPSLLLDRHPDIAQVVYQGRWRDVVGRDVPNGLIGGSFVASSTMFADPAFFSKDTSAAREHQLRPASATWVASPSAKMLFEDLDSWLRIPGGGEHGRTATFSFADASAAAMSQTDFTGDWVSRAMAWDIGPGHTTLNGLAGKDR